MASRSGLRWREMMALSLFNPWVLLGIAIAIGAAGAGGYFKGVDVAENAARAEYATELEAGIASFNEQAAKDQEAAVKVAARNAAAQARASTIRSQSNVAIQEKPLPVICAWEPKSFSLLLAAIKEASGDSADTANKLSESVRRANATGKPER